MRLVLLWMALAASAVLAETGDIQVHQAWSRATPPGATVGVAYMEIRNGGATADRLLSASTPVAKRVELHVTSREGDVMRMRQVQSFEIAPRERYRLRPSGSHLMLVELERPLTEGERFPMLLRFERAGELRVELQVQAMGARHRGH